ncbi:hypothetical protein CR513_32640, partial [Mucuna pruriens]
MSPYRIVIGKAYHLLNTELIRLSSNAIWPMTKQGNKGNSSCKNWTNSAWRPMRTLESISIKSSDFMISKLRSRWDGPFVISNVSPYGVVNGHRIKLFHEGPSPTASDMETISLMEPAQPDDIL